MFQSKKRREPRNRKAESSAQPEQQRDLQGAITQALDFPRSAIPGMAQLELSGNREAIIDGCQGVLEYDESVIKLSTGKMAIKFCGRNLQIKVLTHDSAVVEGFITSIEFIT